MEHLQWLLEAAGHASFRDARHPLGLTQRQSAGKFTRDEASALIEQLEQADSASGAAGGAPREARPTTSPAKRTPSAVARPPARGTAKTVSLRDLPDELLADELVRRGWAVIAP